MKFKDMPYELNDALNCVFKRCKVRIKILLIIYDFPGITDRDVITIASLSDSKKRDILKDLIDNEIVLAKRLGISTTLHLNEENRMVIDLIKYMKNNNYYGSI